MVESNHVIEDSLAGAIAAQNGHQKAEIKNLVIVPGHAIYTGQNISVSYEDKSWIGLLEQNEGRFFIEHIEHAVLNAALDPSSFLIFSGGYTKANTNWSEAESYSALAHQHKWFGRPEVARREATEIYARQSSENLVFSIYRFLEINNRLPEQITIYGWQFKAERYQLHFQGLMESLPIFAVPEEVSVYGGGWVKPMKFNYVGVNNPEGNTENPKSPIALALRNEQKLIELIRTDKLGVTQPELLAKAAKRDPFNNKGMENYVPLVPIFEKALKERYASIAESVRQKKAIAQPN